jgi:hypothetical protein
LSDTQNTQLEFPPLEELPKQPWVRRLSKSARADYEKKRAATIKRDADAIAEHMRSFPGFESVPDAAIEHYAFRKSTRECDAYEEGQEHGRNVAWSAGQAQRDSDAQFRLNVTGNIN